MGTTRTPVAHRASAADAALGYLREECAQIGARLIDHDVVPLAAADSEPWSHLLYAAIDDGGEVGAHILRCHLDPQPDGQQAQARIEHLLDVENPALVDGVSMRLIARLTRTSDPAANQWRLQAVRRTVLRTPFLALLGRVDRLLATDRRRAREAFMHALVATSAEEFAFLDRMATMFTEHPYRSARKWMTQLAEKDPSQREFLMGITPTSDPGLHQRYLAGLDLDLHQVQLDQIDMPRMTWRQDARPRDLALYRTPTRTTDRLTHDPDRIAARAARRTTATPRTQRELDRTRWEDQLYTRYADTRLFVDDHPKAALPEWHPHNSRGDDAITRWARDYYTHVFFGYEPHINWQVDDITPYRPELSKDADELLGTIKPAGERLPRRKQRNQRHRKDGTPWSVTDRERKKFATKRTGMKSDDVREDPMYRDDDYWAEDEIDLTDPIGWPCVSCFIERPVRDQRPVHIRDGVMVSDDGLCDHCRADGRTGIAPLAMPFTFEQYIASRCEYLLDTYPDIAPAMLVRIYHRSAPHPLCRVLNRFFYDRFGVLASNGLPSEKPHAEHAPETAPVKPRRQRGHAPGAGQRHGRCNGCTRHRVVNSDGYCTECRVALGLHEPDSRDSAVA